MNLEELKEYEISGLDYPYVERPLTARVCTNRHLDSPSI
jgi:hypothetical protein